ncbi:Serine/threonine-protein kinase hsl1 [Lodderomyces elongisporus]|uniref:Serine/threonine-protein kinase hsl1 n=1 Tax=Lodderomyces elongisporus TaxID=36914 RepID=UPI0029252522|nr:Serine/threonine-protein kinase hsl1 [Lodderomyces elongisporus]WLF81147.1 Serine/threonine-protein kinase hsl1 [Lodderomyces elongisporus]
MFQSHQQNYRSSFDPNNIHPTMSSIAGAAPSTTNVDRVVQSVTNATKRLSQISTNTNASSKKRKSQNKIGPWKLGRTLGRGSTGRVRLAKNVETGQLAAVKIVPKSNFRKLENPKYKRHSRDSQAQGQSQGQGQVAGDNDNSEDLHRLPYGIEREIIIMKLISHPNIMGLYDVWENKNDLYLILEYIEGGELFDYLIKKGRLHESEAVNYFKQIINGINYLHQFNICHRDLKPENLLLDFNKNIKIADFGMAALEIKERLLETSCGSPHYASPEIVAGKTYHGAPSDIWSCGIILFALLTGHLPFDDENIRKLLLKVQSGKFIMPHELSWEAKDLISKMLKVNPAERISMAGILSHPLLSKYPNPAVTYSKNCTTTLDITSAEIKPIESVAKIDKEILKNLSVLFHNCDENTIMSRLMSQKKCPEKMFYYLLMKYRNEHVAQSNNLSEQRVKTIPRSTSSFITTTIYDDTTGEAITSTTTTTMTGAAGTSGTAGVKTPHTTSKMHKSSSIYSKKSLMKTASSKQVLGNITNKNTTSNQGQGQKQFTASTSFNKNKRRPSNVATQVYSKSRNNSSRSLRSNTSTSNNKSSSSTSSNERKPSSTAPSPPPPPPTTTTTILHNSETAEKTQSQKSTFQTNSASGNFNTKSLLNFKNICDEMFNDNQNLQTAPMKPIQENAPSRTASQRKRENALAKKERELAEQVRLRNEARELKLKAEEEKAKKELEKEKQLLQKKKDQLEQEEKELLAKQELQSRQKQALAKLNQRQSTNDFDGLVDLQAQKRRSLTADQPQIKSLLDPRSNSVARARTLGGAPTSSSPSFPSSSSYYHSADAGGAGAFSSPRTNFVSVNSPQMNDNASKVLHKLGIDVVPSPRKSNVSKLRTSGSRNLAAMLEQGLPTQTQVTTTTNSGANTARSIKTSSSRNLADYLNKPENDENVSITVNDFNEMESGKSIVKTTPKSQSKSHLQPQLQSKSQSRNSLLNNKRASGSSFKSMLIDIDEHKPTVPPKPRAQENTSIIEENDGEEMDGEEQDQYSVADRSNISLIPNPRFSRFSFGGLLKPHTVTNEEGDITIMSQTLNTSNTVVRRSNKSNSTFAGLGIKVRDTIKEEDGEDGGAGAGAGVGTGTGTGAGAYFADNRASTSHNTKPKMTNDRSTFKSREFNYESDIDNNDNFDNYNNYDDDDNDNDDTHSDATTVSSKYSFIASEQMFNNSMQQDRPMETELSNFDIISAKTAVIGKANISRPSLVNSRETLVANPRSSNEETIREESHNELNNEVNNDWIEIEDEQKPSQTMDDRRSSVYIGDGEQKEADSENDGEQQYTHHGGEATQKGDIKRSRNSTCIFSTAQLPRSPRVQLPNADSDSSPVSNNVVDVNRKPSTLRHQTQLISSPIEDVKYENEMSRATSGADSFFRRLSMKPNRAAPNLESKNTAPKEQATRNRFSDTPLGSAVPKPSKFFYESETPKQTATGKDGKDGKEAKTSNWFKRFFNSLTGTASSSGTKSSSSKPLSDRYTSKDIKIIDSSLRSVELIRIIKDQLELKELEGSVSKVSIDEEFGLISGVVPSKFSHGRKLKFRIEVIDLISSSSLHIMKVKGNEKGFTNFVKVVSYIIKKEEQSEAKR